MLENNKSQTFKKLSITFLLIGLCIVVSMYAFSRPDVQYKLMMNPYRISTNKEYYRFLTSGLIHSGYMHLFFNAFTLYFFGRAVEEIFVGLFAEKGIWLFLLLFVLGVVVSDIPTFLKHRHNPGYNSLGASGGVSAIVFAYILFQPTAKLMLIILPIPIPGFILGALYLIYSYYQSKNSADNINHDAHLYGALFGLLYCTLLQPAVIPHFFEQLSHWSLF